MWIITKDYMEERGVVGVSSCNYEESKAALLKYRFRLLDDDGSPYYEGLSDDCDSQRAFAPLDDFGKGYAGCVEIQYFANGCWMRL